jgi:spermidine synthase
MLSLQLGVSIFGVVVTVSAFMAGLGCGSLCGVLLMCRLRRPLVVFAALEAAVALFALATPDLFAYLGDWLARTGADLGVTSWYGIQGALAFLVLFVPALAMGAGFPLFLRVVAPGSVSLGSVYGINTLGGACGALLPLWLLPSLGWTNALYVVVSLGFAVALAALAFSVALRSATIPAATDAAAESRRPTLLALLAYGGLGAGALMLEVGWTRLYGMILLRTEYVLAVILAVFLIGVALGSLAARRWRARAWLNILPAAAALAALVSLWLLPTLARWAESSEPTSLAAALFTQGLAITLLTAPTTVILGAWLPLLTRHLADDDSIAGAWLYGANSVGAAFGALLGGLVLVPWFGTAAVVVIGAALLLLCGLAWAPSRRSWLAAPLLLVAAFPVWQMPPVRTLLPAAQGTTRDLFVDEDALAITHVVEQLDGQRLLLADLRRMDASTDPTAVVVQQNQARLPLLLHPAPRSVLFLGLGTGISASGARGFPDLTGVAVEISEGAILAARQWFAPVNDGVMERLQVVRDDARRFLRTQPQSYDVIIGDLFHPDLVGRGNLLSVQQFARAKQRLGPDGVFVQWLALNQFDYESLSLVLRSFREVFPAAQLFVEGLRVAMVGPRSASFNACVAVLSNLARLQEAAQLDVTAGEGPWTWLGRYWGTIPATSGPVQDEWWPQIEFRLPHARYGGAVDLRVVLENLLRQRPSVEEAAAQLHVPPDAGEIFERAFVASELAQRSLLATLNGRGAESQKLLRLAYGANPQDRWVGFSLADLMIAAVPEYAKQGSDTRRMLEGILAIRPDHVEALRALWRLEREAGKDVEASAYLQRIRALAPLDLEAKAGL